MAQNRAAAAKLYNELKKRINKVKLMERMKIADVDDFDKLPASVQQAVVDALDVATQD